MKNITHFLLIGFFALVPANVHAQESVAKEPQSAKTEQAGAPASKRADLDGDRNMESEIFYETDGRTISKILIDENGDGKEDGIVYYRMGVRFSAERDINFDGKTDAWIKYYMTGIPWVVERDKNGDGRPDYWKYLKNGFVYKREWDRNFDDKVDVRIQIPGKADFREGADSKQLVEKSVDDNFDGQFEKVTKFKKRVPHIRIINQAGAVGEI